MFAFSKVNIRTLMKKYKGALLLLLSIFITSLVVWYCQYPTLINRLLIHRDINTYFFSLYNLLDSRVLSGDLYSQYIQDFTPKGYFWMFYYLGRYFNLISLGIVFPFFLSVFSAAAVFYLAKGIKDSLAGFFASVLFIAHCWTFHVFQAATPKAFALPFLIIFMILLIKRNYILCFAVLILQQLFYPPFALISLVTFLFAIWYDMKPGGIGNRKQYFYTILFISAFFLVYWLEFVISKHGDYGSMVGYKQVLAMSEFSERGRENFFQNGIFKILGSPISGLNLNLSFSFICLVILIFFRERKWESNIKFPVELIFLFFASSILFVLANLFLLKLYFPARYVIFTFPLVLSVLCGVVISVYLYWIKGIFRKIVIFISILIIVVIFYFPRISGRTCDYTAMSKTLKFLELVEQDSMVAATIQDSDPIPTYSKRKVLFSDRLILPYNEKYYFLVKKRVFDFYAAYYSDSLEMIRDFCKKYSVDYIVFRRRDFSQKFIDNIENARYYTQPYASYIYGQAKAKKSFALPEVDKRKIVFEDDGIVVVKTSLL